MIRHHPTEATLVAYAAGTLREALGLVVATHVSQCRPCLDAVWMLESIGGALLNELAPVPMASGALDAVLARSGEQPPQQPPVLNPGLPPPLNRVALGRWWPIGRGIRWRMLRSAGQGFAGLILAQPGRSLPRHGHGGAELTCTLSGAFADVSGVYRAGDLAEAQGDHDQPPRVFGDEPCLCVMGSEGLLLRGVLGRVQKLVAR